ncbi:hypothetical protein GQR58_009291 [Nymphon striatum]|nr:hypothetical protein GQR58_009291 [Nymphon striatum]
MTGIEEMYGPNYRSEYRQNEIGKITLDEDDVETTSLDDVLTSDQVLIDIWGSAERASAVRPEPEKTLQPPPRTVSPCALRTIVIQDINAIFDDEKLRTIFSRSGPLCEISFILRRPISAGGQALSPDHLRLYKTRDERETLHFKIYVVRGQRRHKFPTLVRSRLLLWCNTTNA